MVKMVKFISFSLIVCILIFPETNFAAGIDFLVKPMKITFDSTAGQTSHETISVRNIAQNDSSIFEALVVGINQNEKGFLQPDTIDNSTYSCKEWIKLDENKFFLNPLETKDLEISLKPPIYSRGSYYAGLLIKKTPSTKPNKGIVVVFQFLIPVLVTVGDSHRPHIEILDMGLAPENEKNNATAFINIANKGNIFSQISGYILLDQNKSNRSSNARIELEEKTILPGATVTLSSELPRKTPPGTYTLRPYLTLDGMPLRARPKEVIYAGDPGTEAIDETIPRLEFEAPMAVVDMYRGKERRGNIRIMNPSTSPAAVTASIIPIPGVSQDCSQWMRFDPASFSLEPGRKDTLRLNIAQPVDSPELPYCYGQAVFDIEGGEPADLLVIGRDRRVEPVYGVQPGDISLKPEGDAYRVTGTFQNTGTEHVELHALGRIANTSGLQTLKNIPLDEGDILILPGQSKEISGTLVTGGLEDGVYALELVATSDKDTHTLSHPVEVSGPDTNKRIKLTAFQGE